MRLARDVDAGGRRDAHGDVVIRGISIGLALAGLATAVAPAPPAQAAEVETVVAQHLPRRSPRSATPTSLSR